MTSSCPACPVAAHAARTGGVAVECVCDRRHEPPAPRAPVAAPRPLAPLPLPETTPRAPWRPTSPESDLVGLARALPDLSARSPALQRSGGQRSVVTDGRGDRLDARSRELARAVNTWCHARALCLAGHGADVAVLWGAYVVTATLYDRHGLPLAMTAQHRARCLAVALGAASGPLRESWKSAASVKRGEKILRTSISRLVHQRDREGHITSSTVQTAPVVHRLLTGDVPVSLEHQAVTWGREHLDDLWSPHTVPAAHARGLALGWAPGTERSRWEALGRAVRDLERVAWGERRIREAAAVWRGESEARASGNGGA